jgi:hypothetical protein
MTGHSSTADDPCAICEYAPLLLERDEALALAERTLANVARERAELQYEDVARAAQPQNVVARALSLRRSVRVRGHLIVLECRILEHLYPHPSRTCGGGPHNRAIGAWFWGEWAWEQLKYSLCIPGGRRRWDYTNLQRPPEWW